MIDTLRDSVKVYWRNVWAECIHLLNILASTVFFRDASLNKNASIADKVMMFCRNPRQILSFKIYIRSFVTHKQCPQPVQSDIRPDFSTVIKTTGSIHLGKVLDNLQQCIIRIRGSGNKPRISINALCSNIKVRYLHFPVFLINHQ